MAPLLLNARNTDEPKIKLYYILTMNVNLLLTKLWLIFVIVQANGIVMKGIARRTEIIFANESPENPFKDNIYKTSFKLTQVQE